MSTAKHPNIPATVRGVKPAYSLGTVDGKLVSEPLSQLRSAMVYADSESLDYHRLIDNAIRLKASNPEEAASEKKKGLKSCGVLRKLIDFAEREYQQLKRRARPLLSHTEIIRLDRGFREWQLRASGGTRLDSLRASGLETVAVPPFFNLQHELGELEERLSEPFLESSSSTRSRKPVKKTE